MKMGGGGEGWGGGGAVHGNIRGDQLVLFCWFHFERREAKNDVLAFSLI